MEEKVTLEITAKQLEIIYRGLLELPAKYSFSVVKEIENQVKAQIPDEQPVEETNEETKE